MCIAVSNRNAHSTTKNDLIMQHKTVYFLFIFLVFAPFTFAQYQDFEADIFVTAKGDSLLYRQVKPQKIENGKRYPLVLFLHGAGERASDNVSQLRHGAMMFTNPVNRENYPCFAIFPQCPANLYWGMPSRPSSFKEGTPFPADAEISTPLASTKELLDEILETYPVDKNRIYIIGLSMGGMGTFDMVCRFPELFAAAIPICGGINAERLNRFSSKTAFRIFHGDADSVVLVEYSRIAYRALKKAGANVEYIEFAGIDHGSWNPAFNMPDFFLWLFAQQRK